MVTYCVLNLQPLIESFNELKSGAKSLSEATQTSLFLCISLQGSSYPTWFINDFWHYFQCVIFNHVLDSVFIQSDIWKIGGKSRKNTPRPITQVQARKLKLIMNSWRSKFLFVSKSWCYRGANPLSYVVCNVYAHLRAFIWDYFWLTHMRPQARSSIAYSQ